MQRALAPIPKAADLVIKHIDTNTLALHYGTRYDPLDVDAVTEHAKMDKVA